MKPYGLYMVMMASQLKPAFPQCLTVMFVAASLIFTMAKIPLLICNTTVIIIIINSER